MTTVLLASWGTAKRKEAVLQSKFRAQAWALQLGLQLPHYSLTFKQASVDKDVQPNVPSRDRWQQQVPTAAPRMVIPGPRQSRDSIDSVVRHHHRRRSGPNCLKGLAQLPAASACLGTPVQSASQRQGNARPRLLQAAQVNVYSHSKTAVHQDQAKPSVVNCEGTQAQASAHTAHATQPAFLADELESLLHDLHTEHQQGTAQNEPTPSPAQPPAPLELPAPVLAAEPAPEPSASTQLSYPIPRRITHSEGGYSMEDSPSGWAGLLRAHSTLNPPDFRLGDEFHMALDFPGKAYHTLTNSMVVCVDMSTDRFSLAYALDTLDTPSGSGGTHDAPTPMLIEDTSIGSMWQVDTMLRPLLASPTEQDTWQELSDAPTHMVVTGLDASSQLNSSGTGSGSLLHCHTPLPTAASPLLSSNLAGLITTTPGQHGPLPHVSSASRIPSYTGPARTSTRPVPSPVSIPPVYRLIEEDQAAAAGDDVSPRLVLPLSADSPDMEVPASVQRSASKARTHTLSLLGVSSGSTAGNQGMTTGMKGGGVALVGLRPTPPTSKRDCASASAAAVQSQHGAHDDDINHVGNSIGTWTTGPARAPNPGRPPLPAAHLQPPAPVSNDTGAPHQPGHTSHALPQYDMQEQVASRLSVESAVVPLEAWAAACRESAGFGLEVSSSAELQVQSWLRSSYTGAHTNR